MGVPKIGLALGGGGARGLAHIVMIQAFNELGLKPHRISGTSIGALLGAGFAGGLAGSDIRDFAIRTLEKRSMIMRRLWSVRPSILEFWQKQIFTQLDAEWVIRAFFPKNMPRTFEGLEIPFSVIATDIGSWDKAVFTSGRLIPCIAASIAIPYLFHPVRYHNRLLIDGGVVNPLPIDQANAHTTDVIVAVDVMGVPPGHRRNDRLSALDVGMESMQIMGHRIMAQTLGTYRPDLYFKFDVADFAPYAFWEVQEILAQADKQKDIIKQKLDDLVTRWRPEHDGS